MSKVIHFEIPVDDARRAAAFYQDVLGWVIAGSDEQPYWLVQAGADDEPGANGALTPRDPVHRSPVLIVSVANIDRALVLAGEHGGRVVQEKLPVPGIGWSAYVEDPEGNTVGLFQTGGGM